VKKNNLITLSFICLRTCLEALRMFPNCMIENPHLDCTRNKCKVRCIADLEKSLNSFLTELSKVFFKKDNLRSRDWWLSAFYTFCIQAMVRRGLQELISYRNIDDPSHPDHTKWSAVQQYLIIAVRLFVAITGSYDPLVKDYSAIGVTSILKTVGEKASDENFKAAQIAVKQEIWNSNGIANSIQYLQNLFEDNGEPWTGTTAGASTSVPSTE